MTNSYHKQIYYRGLMITMFILMSVGQGYCDIYRYIDSQGIMHFTNTPTSLAEYTLYIREKPSFPIGTILLTKYDELIAEAAKRHGISVPLIKALIKVESNFNPRAVSKKGAKGLMQLMPANIKALKIKSPFDPRENVMGGTKYLKRLLKRFHGKLSLALAAYNAGPELVDRYKSIPPIKETEDYVKRVLKYYDDFKKG